MHRLQMVHNIHHYLTDVLQLIFLRKTCRQRCISGDACRSCYHLLHLADPELLKPYKEQLEENAD